MSEHKMPRHEQVIDALEDIVPVYGESECSPNRAADRAIYAACSMIREQAERIAVLEYECRALRQHAAAWLRACVLAKWPTRKALEAWCRSNLPGARVHRTGGAGGDYSTLTGGERSTLTAGYCSTLTGGDYSTLTGGERSTLTAGYCSTLTGGDHSILTGGDCSTLTGGERSTLTGGDYSTLTGGDYSTLTGGYCSTLTGGDHSILTGGDRTVMAFDWFGSESCRWHRTAAVVGRDGIEAGVPYRCVGGKIVRDDEARTATGPLPEKEASRG